MSQSLPSPFPRPALPAGLRPDRWPWLAQVLVAGTVLAGLFLGILFSPFMTLGALVVFAVALPGLALSWVYPEFGLLLLIFLGSRILDPTLVEIRLPVGGGIELPDLTLLGLTGLAVLRQALRRNLHLPATWVLPPLLVWLWLAVFSALLAVLRNGVEISWALNELRGLGYYAIFLLVAWEIRTPAQLARLLVGLFAIGLFVVAIMLVTQFVGPVPLFSGMESSTWQIIGMGAGVTRIRPPAHVLLYFLSILSFVLAAYLRPMSLRVLSFATAVFLNLALLLTFTRSQWVASALAVAVCVAFFPRRAKAALFGLALVLGVVGAALLATQRDEFSEFVSEVNFATPLVARIESVFELDETLDSYSAQTRYFQTDAALASIEENPVLGVGLGNVYRGLTAEEARTRYTRFLRFVENSYLYLTTKMGIPALLVFYWLAAAVLWGAFRNFRRTAQPLLKGVSLACLTSFAGIIVWAFNHPLLMLPEYTIMVGLIAGISEAAGLIHRENANVESTL